MSDSTPEIPQDEQAAHDAAVDALLEATLAEDADDQPAEEPADEEEDSFEGPITYDEADEGDAVEDEAAEEQPEETTPAWSEEDRANAFLALRRSGLEEEDIQAMSPDAMVRAGLRAREVQRKVDAKFATGQVDGGSDSSEAPEGQAEFDDSGASREFDDSAVGADLASEARPVVEKLMELDDPEEGAAMLADLVSKAASRQAAQQVQLLRLEQRAAQRLGGYEGDISKLMDEAQKLGQAGRHSDKTGMERFDALLDDAARLSGIEVSRTTSTNRSAKSRAARPPMQGKRVAAKPRSEAERLDARMNAILNGERDVSKLRSI